MKVLTVPLRVWFDEDSTPMAVMFENGTDTIYTLKRATKADKDELFESNQIEK